MKSLFEDGRDGDKLRGLPFELSVEVLKGVGIVYSIIVNFLLMVSWVWLPCSGFTLRCSKVFYFVNKICVVVVFGLFSAVHVLCLIIWFSYLLLNVLVARGRTRPINF
jgi:hypothetical protein